MELFFDPTFEASGNLSENESRHCISVLRHKKDDIITVANGQGHFYTCRIIEPHPKRCGLEVIETKSFDKRNFNIHIAIAPTKNIDRFEWFLEKVTEIGIETITPLLCDHSERSKLRLDRMEKVLIAATKQSLHPYKPIIHELTPFKQFITQPISNGFIAHCYPGTKTHLKDLYQSNQSATILIGPEGDFSKAEVELAQSKGLSPISLGNSRLRTETAGIVACHIINLLNE
ncbi:16S rRNA (uracil(1498)-N(3))-methyltransferase [Marinilabiliaceae bacterium JC017]|nr:16S rRNA (uracil(1498)-N(3))-methyltransferase [Marinilabiliaceae bacterium JC017]